MPIGRADLPYAVSQIFPSARAVRCARHKLENVCNVFNGWTYIPRRSWCARARELAGISALPSAAAAEPCAVRVALADRSTSRTLPLSRSIRRSTQRPSHALPAGLLSSRHAPLSRGSATTGSRAAAGAPPPTGRTSSASHACSSTSHPLRICPRRRAGWRTWP